MVQGNDWSNVGKLVFKSSIRFLGSGQRLIERWKAHFQQFNSFTWFRATTDRALESSFSRVRFVFLVQGNDWSSVGKLIFKSSIRLLGSGQRLIECWKARFQEFDSFTWFRATTDRALESSFSRVRFVFLVQGNNWSNVGKLIFKSSICFLGSGQGLIERWKAHFQEFDSFSSVVALNRENESNSWKWAFQHSISRCPEPSKRIELLKMSFPTFDGSGQRLIECWKAHFQEFDSFSRFRATTDRMLESSFSRVQFVYLVQGNDWSNVGKLIFKSSIPLLQSLPWTKKTNRTLENELSNIRSVFALNQENESNSWKRAFQHSISRCPEPRKRIELLKTSFPTFDQSLPWTKKTNRTLENELSNIRSVLPWTKKTNRTLENELSNARSLVALKSLPWTKKTNRTLENELSNIRSVVALNQVNESNSWKRAFQHSISRCPEPSKRIELLKMSFPTLDGSGQRLIECWKARFQEFDSFTWFRATTDRALESSFSRVQFVYLVQGNDWSSVGKLVFKSSIRFLGSGQGLIECWKAHFQEFDSFSSVVALNQENESNSWKRAFQHSISPCPEPRKRIELLKTSFPTFDQSLPWTEKTNRTLENELSNIRWFRATTDRMLESSFSRVRFVFLVQGKDWSNVGKLVFKSSIRFLGSGQRLIECWKAHFQEFDSFSRFRATTDRALESSFSRVRFVFLVQGNDWSSVGKLISRVRFVFLVQGKDWSNVGKLVFKSSIRFLGSGQRLIERWKAHFEEFDSFSWFRATTDRALESSFSRVRFVSFSRCPEPRKRIELLKMSFPTFDQSLPWTKKTNWTLENELSNIRWFRATTDRMLESSFSRVRFVFLVQGNDWSNVGKLIFKSSIRFLGSGQRLIECWKAHFQEFDSFTSVVALNQENESNSWKWAFQHSSGPCPEPRKRIELLKTSFPTFDQSLPWTKKTNRTLENELSNIRSVVALNQENESNSWKWAFQHSISRCPEPSKRIELLKMSFPTFDGSGQRLIECWKAHFQEFDSFSWFRATTDRMLESSFSRVQFVYLVQGNDWSNVGKLIFKSSIPLLGSGQRLIERWKAHFQEFDSFSWFRATTDRMLESSFSRVRFIYLVQGKDWSNVGELIFKSSIRFLQSLPWTKKTNRTLENELSNIRSVVALNQENESNSWKWAFQHSISRCPEPRKRIELLKMSFPTFDQSLPWTKKTNRTLENELSNIRSVVALNRENESNSWKRAFQHSMVQGNDWSNVGKLVFKSSIRFLGSGQRLIECWKARFQEFDSFSRFRATTDRMLESSFSRVRFVFLVQGKDWSNVGKLVFKSSIRFLGSGQGLIERWKAHFQEFDSFTSVVALNQENESNSWKRAFQHSISRCPEPRKRIELLKTSFPTFDQSLPWTKKTNRTLENELSNIRSVVALNQENESNSWKWAFQHSISRCPEPRKRIELLKTSFPTFDQSLPWTK